MLFILTKEDWLSILDGQLFQFFENVHENICGQRFRNI